MATLLSPVGKRIIEWVLREDPSPATPCCDFKRLSADLAPGDVLLVEGRTRVSYVIRLITQSVWTHAALYVGPLSGIRDERARQLIACHSKTNADEPLLIEALLGEGVITSPLAKYRLDNLRVCRPTGLAPQDARKIITYAARKLGTDYDVRQLLDLARFLFPWSVLPRRWRSSLFAHNAGTPTRTVCSSMLAEAFSDVGFPILPFIDTDSDGRLTFFKRNPRLFTPRDFDYSPYFTIIKHPLMGLDDFVRYRVINWGDPRLIYNDGDRVNPRLAQPSIPPAAGAPSPAATTGAQWSWSGALARLFPPRNREA